MGTLKKNIKYTIFCDRLVGQSITATSLSEVIDKMGFRLKNSWSNIKYKDSDNRTINITREFLDAGMSQNEIIADYIHWGNEHDFNEEILSI